MTIDAGSGQRDMFVSSQADIEALVSLGMQEGADIELLGAQQNGEATAEPTATAAAGGAAGEAAVGEAAAVEAAGLGSDAEQAIYEKHYGKYMNP